MKLLMNIFANLAAVVLQTQYEYGPSHPCIPEYSWHFADDGAICAIHGLISPQAWHYDGKTYVVYQGRMNAPHITFFDHKTARWAPIVNAGVNPLGDLDTHGAPAMIIDKKGYIHLFFGSHGGRQMYKRSRLPGDITEWENMPPVTSNMTYPCGAIQDDGTMILIGRQGGHVAPWIELTGADDGKTWSEEKAIVDITPDGLYGTVKSGMDGKSVHFTWCLQSKSDLHKKAIGAINTGAGSWWTGVWDERHDCYYIWRDEKSQWRNIQGEILQTPIDLKTARQKCQVYRADWPYHGQHGTMGIGGNNQPHIVFLNGLLSEDKSRWTADNMTYTHKFARWNGKQWDISDITTTDSMWDMGQAILPGRGATIDVYLIADGSVTTFGRWGGDLQHWRSNDHGETWTKVRDVITFAKTGRLFNCPLEVVNAHPDGKFVFCTWTTDKGYRSDDFTHLVYLYGDSGFCKKRYKYSLLPQ